MASKSPTARLTRLALSEVAFVAAGDNPKAKIALMKRRSSTDEVPVEPESEALKKSNEELTKSNQELKKRLEALEEEGAVAKVVEVCKGAGLKPELVPHLRALQKAAPTAYEPVLAELARLQKVASATSELTKRVGSVGQVAKTDAQTRLETLVAAGVAKGLTREAATVDAYSKNPDLYTELAYGL
jgi:hypothetical protein